MSLKGPCPSSDMEDTIMEHSLGVPKNENFTTTRPRFKPYYHENQGRHNHTDHFYAGIVHLGNRSMFASPIVMASVVIGMVITISCITIILGSLRWDRQAPRQRQRRRPRRPPYPHPHRYSGGSAENEDLERRCRSLPPGHCTCSFVGGWLTSFSGPRREAETIQLHPLYPDAPPCYEECMGPGATQLYLPTEAPPPYALIDSGYPQAHGGLQGANSMDAPPPYEAVCGPCPPPCPPPYPPPCPPPRLLPLPGPKPEPSGFRGPPAPNASLVSSPEMIV